MRRIIHDYRRMFYLAKRMSDTLLSSLEAMEFVGKKRLNTNEGGAYKNIWSCTNRQPPQIRAELKNGWRYACTSPRAFLACYQENLRFCLY